MSVTAAQIPGYEAAVWEIDATHSEVSFSVRNLGISKVRGNFSEFSGEIVTAENPADSTVNATVAVKSVSTNEANRDAHLLNSDFFAADEFPTLSFVSNRVELEDAESGKVYGDLTMRGVTKPVVFDLELSGFGADPYGGQRLGLAATTVVDRLEFGMNFNAAVEASGALVVGNKVTISLELEAVKK